MPTTPDADRTPPDSTAPDSTAPKSTAGDKPATAGQVDETEEARNLAEESLEAAHEGDAAEASFLADEARALDPDAAEAVLGKG